MSAGTRSRGVPLIVIAAVLTFGSGAMDLASFTRLGGVFSSVMTGNLVLLGLAVARHSGSLAVHAATAIGGYVVGTGVDSRIDRGLGRETRVWPASVTTTLVIELTTLVALAVGWEVTAASPEGGAQLGLLAGASLAMGMQSAAIRRVGTAVSTTYLTGTLTGAVAALVSKDRGRQLDPLAIAVLVAAAAGAAAAGGLLAVDAAAVPVLPLGALAIVIGVVSTAGTHD